jgi:putative tryptophan/tyrosine transport system substrate-binding protein
VKRRPRHRNRQVPVEPVRDDRYAFLLEPVEGNAAAAKQASASIPIVMAYATDPVRTRLIPSLAQPGGNVTGLTNLTGPLSAERRELLRDAVPGLAHVAMLWTPGNPDRADEFQFVEAAAIALGLELRSLEARDAEALGAAFERAAAERLDGLYLLDNPVLGTSAPRVGELARRHRLPMLSGQRVFVAAGGLLAYGPDRPALYCRAAYYVDRILKGASPAEMPVERPTAFDLVINHGTAQALGLTIPPPVLQQTTEVIQ